jgi:hypothetical protein
MVVPLLVSSPHQYPLNKIKTATINVAKNIKPVTIIAIETMR